MTFRQTAKRFFEPVKYVRKSYIFSFFSELRDVFQSVFIIQVWVYIIQSIENNDIENIWLRSMILWITYLVSLIIIWIRQWSNEYLANMMEFSIKKEYFQKFLNMSNTEAEKLGTGKLQNILLRWTGERQWTLAWNIPYIIVEILGICYAFIVIWMNVPNYLYFLWFTIISLLSFLFIRIWLQKLNKTRLESKEVTMELSREEVKLIMSKFEIIQNNKFDKEILKQQSLVEKNIRLRQRGNLIKYLRQSWSDILINWLTIFLYISVWISIVWWLYSLAFLLLMIQLLNLVSRYIRNLRNYFKTVYNSRTHIEKLWETFDDIKLTDYDKWLPFMYKSWNVELQNIIFWYEESKVFNNFSLNLKWWTKTAFVWESGWGKTTLIKLLAGYLRPDNGEIIIDGQKLSEIKLTDYYRHIGYLTQEPSVFDGTIWENLTYALDDVGTDSWSVHDDGTERGHATSVSLQSQIEQVIKLSKCEFIYEFEYGLQTEIGERGVRLSGGQKQRLAIAKIMLKNPNIILLDEPTSALDSFNEELVSEALNNLFKWKTVIVVAHRLQTVKNADRILYIEWWRVIEDGTHASLIKKNGKYKKMLDLQSGF
jgi:ABC-type multidrug transport system fused ATPase/permease subunit